jgi:hypothetical protein
MVEARAVLVRSDVRSADMTVPFRKAFFDGEERKKLEILMPRFGVVTLKRKV